MVDVFCLFLSLILTDFPNILTISYMICLLSKPGYKL